MSQFWLVLGYIASWDSYLGPRVGEEVTPHMEWSLVHVFPPNYPNQIRLGWSLPFAYSHVLHMCLHMGWLNFPN